MMQDIAPDDSGANGVATPFSAQKTTWRLCSLKHHIYPIIYEEALSAAWAETMR
jgi:hypothetical protein